MDTNFFERLEALNAKKVELRRNMTPSVAMQKKWPSSSSNSLDSLPQKSVAVKFLLPSPLA